MYGMLLESVQHFVQSEYGYELWTQALHATDCKHTVFNTHQIYPDNLILDLADALGKITDKPFEYFMNYFGRCFVRFCSNFGYDKMLKATGRYYCDFLESVDNIHLQMRFTYPKIKSPSMQLAHTDEEGAILVYRSTRTGFSHYFMGQLYEIAESFYNLDVKIRILDSKNDSKEYNATENIPGSFSNRVVVKYRLDFDNQEYMITRVNIKVDPSQLSLPSVDINMLLSLFPFSLVLNHDMRIERAGEKVIETWALHYSNKPCKSLVGSNVMEYFKLRRPKGIILKWKTVKSMRSVFFEMELVRTGQLPEKLDAAEIKKDTTFSSAENEKSTINIPTSGARRGSQGFRNILLKGPMYYIQDIDLIIFLCSPLINNLDELHGMGLFLNDLNPHGLSKEMVMAGWQHCSKLELMFEREENRSQDLEKSLELADSWKRKGDELLYSMIPRPVAERLSTDPNPLSTCQSFDEVSVLFGELLNHTYSGDCVQGAMEAVTTLNTVFTAFDEEIISPMVYKVETVGQVYMAVSGAPDINDSHAHHAADLALRMIKRIKSLHLPDVCIKIGIHSGPVVAGVVGIKVPRYCLFGDTVNTASRMESSGEANKIQISSVTATKLRDGGYILQPRGTVKVKGKGEMETFWLVNKLEESSGC